MIDWREAFEIGNNVDLIWFSFFEKFSNELDKALGDECDVNKATNSAVWSLIKDQFLYIAYSILN